MGSPNFIFSGLNPWNDFPARPGVVEAFNCDRHNRDLHVNREDRRALLEDARLAVNAALSFGIEHQYSSLFQSKSSSAHGGKQVGIGIEDDHAQRTRQLAHESRTEDFAGTHRKDALENFPRHQARENQRVQKTLMVRRKNIRTLFRQLLKPFDLQMKAVIRDHLRDAAHAKPEHFREGLRPGQRQDLRIGRLFREQRSPSGKLGA